MSVVTGMDQHRAQISAEWSDTITFEAHGLEAPPRTPRR
jgi:hypothetical protein